MVHSNVRDGSAAAIETGMSELAASSSSIVPGIMRVGIGADRCGCEICPLDCGDPLLDWGAGAEMSWSWIGVQREM